MNTDRLLRHLALLTVGLLYGANFAIAKISVPDHIGPFALIFIRVVVATLFFWMISRNIREKINWKVDGRRLVLCAILGVGINMLFFFKGLSLTSAIHASLIMTLTPTIVFTMSVILIGEKITPLKVSGLLIGLVGASIIIYQPKGVPITGDWLGDLMIFLNAVSYGSYLVLVKPLLNKYHPITIIKWAFTLGNFIVIPVGFSQFMTTDWSSFDTTIWFSISYVVVGVTIIAYLVNIWAMQKTSPSTIGVYIYVQPVFAVLVATLFFEELFTLKHLIASILVFIGVGMVVNREKIRP
ncbi:DMT family transporter [Marinoscillum sp. MHG1-6]|uniref:DMT family transporter n=1 Tax=Marinoscillum sp. MHG1-6 TaxID=2959627 RepID=UPI0021577866|nr:DMT family transporter [Marinoscillum sp. MHG1-6]